MSCIKLRFQFLSFCFNFFAQNNPCLGKINSPESKRESVCVVRNLQQIISLPLFTEHQKQRHLKGNWTSIPSDLFFNHSIRGNLKKNRGKVFFQKKLAIHTPSQWLAVIVQTSLLLSHNLDYSLHKIFVFNNKGISS